MCFVCRGRASKKCDVPALQAISGLAVGGVAAALRHVQRGQHLLQQRQAGMLHMTATISFTWIKSKQKGQMLSMLQ